MFKLLCAIAFCSVLCLPTTAAAEDFVEGKNYHMVKKPVKYQDTDKIEVLMFLWYRCSGCYKLDKKITAWADNLPDDVVFKRLPALFFPNWEFHGRIYLTMEALGASYEQHHAIFDLLQVDKVKVDSEADLPAVFAKTGVDKDKFMEIFNSVKITEQIEGLQSLIYEYEIQAVPAMVINGRYRYTVKDTEGPRFLELADYLINLERDAHKK